MTSVEERVRAYLDKYMTRTIGGGWRVEIETVANKDMELAANGEPGIMSVHTRAGEMKLSLHLNAEADWEEQDLELTVVHELVHAIDELLGHNTAANQMRAELARINPIAFGAHRETVDRLWEEVIDRVANAIVGDRAEIFQIRKDEHGEYVTRL